MYIYTLEFKLKSLNVCLTARFLSAYQYVVFTHLHNMYIAICIQPCHTAGGYVCPYYMYNTAQR